MYALIQNGVITRYPYSITDLRKNNPQISLPLTPDDTTLSNLGAARIYFSTQPEFNSSTHALQEATPVYVEENDRWEQVWEVRPLTTEELDQRKQQIQDQIVAATQTRLDDFARTRNYDSILSASTYATSPTAKFQQEGQYAVQARDATWAALYSILADVLAGTRPMPTGYEEIEPELPALVWPE